MAILDRRHRPLSYLRHLLASIPGARLFITSPVRGSQGVERPTAEDYGVPLRQKRRSAHARAHPVLSDEKDSQLRAPMPPSRMAADIGNSRRAQCVTKGAIEADMGKEERTNIEAPGFKVNDMRRRDVMRVRKFRASVRGSLCESCHIRPMYD